MSNAAVSASLKLLQDAFACGYEAALADILADIAVKQATLESSNPLMTGARVGLDIAARAVEARQNK